MDDWRALSNQAADVISNDWYSLRIRTRLSEH